MGLTRRITGWPYYCWVLPERDRKLQKNVHRSFVCGKHALHIILSSSSSFSVPDASHLAAMGTNEWPPLSSILLSSPLHRSMPVQLIPCTHLYYLSIAVWVCLFLFLLNLACTALCGIRSTVILSTCPNHRSLPWTTLSITQCCLAVPVCKVMRICFEKRKGGGGGGGCQLEFRNE